MARLLIKFTKTNRAKFISHLDTMRTLHRAFRRASVPISYSEGFNPHASISVAAPLSLGVESISEYADVEINGDLDYDSMKLSLNEALPQDMRILEMIEIKGKAPSAMAAVEYARYILRFTINAPEIDEEQIVNNIMDKTEILKMKRTKSGEKLINVRPLIESLIVDTKNEDAVVFESILKAGSNGSLGTDILSNLIIEASNNVLKEFPFIRREEIYITQDSKKIPLLRYFAGK